MAPPVIGEDVPRWVMLPVPVCCTIRPRVVIPREHPGVPAPKVALEWRRLRQLASFRTQPEVVPVSVLG